MKKPYVIGLSALFIFASAYAQNNADNLLNKLQNKFKTIKDVSADFAQSTNGKVTLEGTFLYEKDNRLRIELKNILIVTDGETSWNYNKRENKVIISSYNPDDPSYFSLKQIIDVYPSKCNLSSAKENGNDVLILTPNKASLNFKMAKIYINSEDLLSKIILTDLNDKLVQVSFSNYKLNGKPGKSAFTFTPPKGSKVIDLR